MEQVMVKVNQEFYQLRPLMKSNKRKLLQIFFKKLSLTRATKTQIMRCHSFV